VVTVAGKTRRLPVASRGVAFDAQLGTTRAGAQVAIYSRCRRDPSRIGPYRTGQRCSLYSYSFSRRLEKHLAWALPKWVTSAFLPAVSEGEIAFAARRSDGDIAVYLRSASGTFDRLRLARPGGDDPRIGTRHGEAAGPTSLALRDGVLAYSWEYTAQRASCGTETSLGAVPNWMIVVRRPAGAPDVVAHGNCPEDATGRLDQVALPTPNTVRFLAAPSADQTDVRSVSLTTGQVRKSTVNATLTGYATDGRRHALGYAFPQLLSMAVLPR
jgi:hypothetical protein